MRLLLISNSTNLGERYLEHPGEAIRNFLGSEPRKALFLPYAAVTFSYEEYEKKVSDRFRELGHDIISIHRFSDPVEAVRNAQAIVVGGGNTWQLLKQILSHNLTDVVREKVIEGIPYIGWSAGANVACPSIRTTNDMPVCDPGSMSAFNLIPFQINPHYIDANPAGHAGETREQRIMEFIELNPELWIIGLREGTMLRIENGRIMLSGQAKARIFRKDHQILELGKDDDLSFLMT
ncbi:MAG: dipeptidase PepE [Bacteroidales bacterium]|jgi:dipeptidase E